MKKIILLITLIVFTALCYSQEYEKISGYIPPGSTFSNNTSDTLIFINTDFLDRILQVKIKYNIAVRKIELLKEQVSVLEQRKQASDSAINLKSNEAEFWRMKLLANDDELKEQRIMNAELRYENNRIRKSRIYYILGGILATTIVYIAVK